MRIVLFVAVIGLVSASASAQVTVEVSPPSVTFKTPPPLVDIGNGVQVVPGIGEEVFFADSYYWTRHGGHWFRTKDYLGGWVLVEDKDVPPALLNLPRGKYRHYNKRKEGEGAPASDEAAKEREERARERAEQRDEAERAREERAQERARERAEQRDEADRARQERAQERRDRAEQAEESRDRRRNRSERSKTQNARSGPEAFPGANEISAHIGYQAGFAGKFANPSGFKLFAEYARRLSDLVWLDVQANNVFGFGSVTGTCFDQNGNPFPCAGFYYGGWNFELAVGVKLKIKTSIPLVVEVPLVAALEVLYNRQCGDTGVAPAARVGGGVKYFVTRSIGVGGGINFALGPGFHGASNCGGSYTDFYGAFDFQVGAEFIF
jgi:hypothetical protein